MPTYTVHAAKTNLAKLIERAEKGEEVVIARGRKPVARLVPMGVPAHVLRRRAFGEAAGFLLFRLPSRRRFEALGRGCRITKGTLHSEIAEPRARRVRPSAGSGRGGGTER